jgi:hypothetical protein
VADDDVTPTVEDVSAGDALSAVIEKHLSCYDTVMNVRAEADELTRLIGAAVRAMTVEQQAQLIGARTERARFDADGDYYRHVDDPEDEAHLRRYSGTIRSRVVGAWRAEP